VEWFRWYHGAASDAKWPIIARKSGQNVGTVVAVWAALLEHASQAECRGSLAGFDCESLDALFGFEDGVTQAVFDAMSDPKRGLILDDRVVAWDKRQPVREDSSAARTRTYRERKAGHVTTSDRGNSACDAT
jgi:hypothetical protein